MAFDDFVSMFPHMSMIFSCNRWLINVTILVNISAIENEKILDIILVYNFPKTK